MNSDRWLVALGAGPWQVRGILAARAAGLKVLAVDASRDAPGLTVADKNLVVDIRNQAQVIEGITVLEVKPAGVVAFCNEAGMLTAAALREHFGLPGPGVEVTRRLTNKGLQRRRWTEEGLPCPQWFVARSASDVEAGLAKIDGTVIFKPVDSAGSRGVTVVQKAEPWESAFEEAKKSSLANEVIVESFIVGVEHTVETFTHRNQAHILAITSKKKVPGTRGTVAYELTTADLSREKWMEATDICSQALAALGYEDGAAHTEFLLNNAGEIFLVESAGRGGGFMVADGIVPGVSGFDLATACALQAVGLEPPLPPAVKPKAAVLRFIPSRPGRIVKIEGFADNDCVPGVVSEAMVVEGQEVGRAASDGDRMAYILAIAETIPEALTLADEKEKRIRIEVR